MLTEELYTDISAELADIKSRENELANERYTVYSKILNYTFKNGKFKGQTIQNVIYYGNKKYVEYMLKNGFIPFKINSIDWYYLCDIAVSRASYETDKKQEEIEKKKIANMSEEEYRLYQQYQEIQGNRNLRDWGM